MFRALREYWLATLPQGERLILVELAKEYPRGVAREELDERTSFKRSSRDTYLQRLAARRLIEVPQPGVVRASAELFEGGLMRTIHQTRLNHLVLALFPGIDLLGRAFEAEGFTVVRGPDVLWGGDIRAFHPPAGVWGGIIGGPPCQTFSLLAHLVRARGYEPSFGDLIPEYQRCVEEARPGWFLMEEVPGAPVPEPPGYGIHSFQIDHCALDGGDGLGLEQERRRVFTFGVRGRPAVDLRRWIKLAALLLPARSRAATQGMVDNSDEAKGRVRSGTVVSNVTGFLSDPHAVPVAIGGSGKRKPGCRMPAVTSSDGAPLHGGRDHRVPAVTGAHAGAGRRKSGHLIRYRLPEAMRLQGCPPEMIEQFVEHHPFRADAALKLIANGVPIALGRAVARAVRQAVTGGFGEGPTSRSPRNDQAGPA